MSSSFEGKISIDGLYDAILDAIEAEGAANQLPLKEIRSLEALEDTAKGRKLSGVIVDIAEREDNATGQHKVGGTYGSLGVYHDVVITTIVSVPGAQSKQKSEAFRSIDVVKSALFRTLGPCADGKRFVVKMDYLGASSPRDLNGDYWMTEIRFLFHGMQNQVLPQN